MSSAAAAPQSIEVPVDVHPLVEHAHHVYRVGTNDPVVPRVRSDKMFPVAQENTNYWYPDAESLWSYNSTTRPLSTSHLRSNRTFCSIRRSCVTNSSAPS